jgi:hypothetical protein
MSKFDVGFRRSRRGNLWREYHGLTVTVYQTPEGLYGWCLAGPESQGPPRLSSEKFETEVEALEDVQDVLADLEEGAKLATCDRLAAGVGW